jgi:hypothetical protein
MDKFVTRTRGVSGDSSAAASSSLRSSSPILNESCDMDSQRSLTDPVTVTLDCEETRDPGNQGQEGNEDAVKELKSYLLTLER